MKRLKLLAALACGTAPIAAIAQQPAATAETSNSTVAQDTVSGGIEDIVVTAQKRQENLQDVPISITAFSAAALEAKGIKGIQDLAAVPPPGLAIQSFAGANQIIIIDIRGVSNPDPGQGTTELGTAVYLDDVYLGRAQGLGADLADPERIEVLRGPQGTLFGRNAEGGAIRIISRKPTGEFGVRGKVTVGNYDQERYEAHIDLPEIAGFSVKLDYLNSHTGPFTKNGPNVTGLASQHGFGIDDSEGYRASVRWRPVAGLTVDYAYDHSRNSNTSDYPIVASPNPVPLGYSPNPAFLLVETRRNESFSERVDRSLVTDFNEPFVTKGSGHTLTAEYELSDVVTAKSISSYRRTSSSGSQQLKEGFGFVPFEFTPGILSPLPAVALSPDPRFGTLGTVTDPLTPVFAVGGPIPFASLRQRQYSQELQLLGSTDTLEWVLGAYYFNERVVDARQTFFSELYLDSAALDGTYSDFVPTNPFSLPFPGQGLNSQDARSRSYAAFAQATWSPDFADGRLHITPGLRYTDDRKVAVRNIQSGAPVNLVTVFSAKRFDPALTVAYDITSDVNFYLRYAQAYRAGGTSVRDTEFRPFNEEVNKAYEVGFKSVAFDRRVLFNFAAFYNDISGRQLVVQTDPNNPALTRTINAPGKSPVWGIEMELTVKPVANLSLGVTYAYQEGDLDEAALQAIDPSSVYFIPNLPANSGSFTVDYVFPPLSFGKLAFHADYAWADKFDSTVRLPITAFAPKMKRDVANARLSLQDIEVGPAQFTLSGFVKNIFDTAYPTFTSPNSNAYLSLPRTFGVELGVEF